LLRERKVLKRGEIPEVVGGNLRKAELRRSGKVNKGVVKPEVKREE